MTPVNQGGKQPVREHNEGAKFDASAPAKKKIPRYIVLEKCYLNERIYDPESQPMIVTGNAGDADESDEDSENPHVEAEVSRAPLFINFTGVPAYYLKPVNAAAELMCEKHAERMEQRSVINDMAKLQYSDPVGESDVVRQFMTMLAKLGKGAESAAA